MQRERHHAGGRSHRYHLSHRRTHGASKRHRHRPWPQALACRQGTGTIPATPLRLRCRQQEKGGCMTHASLFSGIGGPEVAAAMLGWENLFHCEINPFGRAVLDYWFPNSKSYEDVTKQDFTEWRGQVDVLTGGFPCQPFSYAGERRGADDDRYLWPHFKRVISEVRPSWVVGENVAGITTMVEQGEVFEMDCQTSLFGASDDIHRYRHRQTQVPLPYGCSRCSFPLTHRRACQ